MTHRHIWLSHISITQINYHPPSSSCFNFEYPSFVTELFNIPPHVAIFQFLSTLWGFLIYTATPLPFSYNDLISKVTSTFLISSKFNYSCVVSWKFPGFYSKPYIKSCTRQISNPTHSNWLFVPDFLLIKNILKGLEASEQKYLNNTWELILNYIRQKLFLIKNQKGFSHNLCKIFLFKITKHTHIKNFFWF